ncbi:MAG: DNA polymerase IV [Gammaproteobacteria bacterium]|nr:MAG: DNA polymerase IV [Gammaproteobacteria bacterium]
MDQSLPHHKWTKMIALMDMNAFFASIEQKDYPWWRGRPVAVTNGKIGTGIITCSYEARAFGVHTGMRLVEARKLCPQLIQAPARPYRYAEVSRSIMHSLENITPDLEIFSVDEAFLDLSHCQRLYHYDPWQIGKLIKQVVFDISGLLCSVGLSGDRSTAKWAAKQMKPNGLTIIKPELAEQALAEVSVTDLCGVNKGIGRFLAQYGVYRCADMKHIPISVLGQRFGNPGKRIWLMAQGKDPEVINGHVCEAKTLGHGKVIPPNTTKGQTILLYLMHMAEKVAARLRLNQLQAQVFSIAFKTINGWQKTRSRTISCTDDGKQIFKLCKFFFQQKWQGEGVFQVHVAALDPRPASGQQDFFIKDDQDRQNLHQMIDKINHRYGEFTLCNAPLLNRSSMPNVIAPAWKPDGHRNTLEH